jgi:nucleotide-binding universal stress UspA family protein
MIVLKHILVPTDFSEASSIAVKYGAAFAQAFQATLHVLHIEGHRDFEAIVEAQRVVDEALGAAGAADAERDLTVRQAAHELLAGVLTPAEQQGIRVEYVLRDGGDSGPYAEIVRFAREQTIDLIIIGSRGRGALAHMLRGSVVDRVVHEAPCPVMTVHKHEHEFILQDDGPEPSLP